MYGFGALGLSRGVSAGRVGESAAARCFVWACQGSGQTDICFDDWLIEGAAQFRGMHGFCIFMHYLRPAGFLPSCISGLLLLISYLLLLTSYLVFHIYFLSLISYFLPFFRFSTWVFNMLWKLDFRVWICCGVAVRWVGKRMKYPVFSCIFALWISAFHSFPHQFSKGCGKPVRVFGKTKIHMPSPHLRRFCPSCGKREILYNSGNRPGSGGGEKNRVWITQANPQVSEGISQFRLWLPGRIRPVVRYTVLVKIPCCTGGWMGGFGRMHNKIRFSTILPPLLLLLLLYS